MKITIGIVDDHQLLVKSLAMLINSFPDFEVVVDALNGKELLDRLSSAPNQPDIILIDVNMDIMDGPETAEKVSTQYPLIKMVALSLKEDDLTVIKMIRAGCCAYLVKDIHPDELEKALIEVNNQGYYNSDISPIKFGQLVKRAMGKKDVLILSEKEKRFLQLSCSDLTYKQIAAEMHQAERTIDGYREALFEKLGVQSRVGMVLEAVRRGLVNVDKSIIN